MQKKIYIVCPEIKAPTGGIKQLYKLCEILQKNNFEVAIIHGKKGFKNTWFHSDTKIKYYPFLFFKIKKLIRKKKFKYIFKDFFQLLFMSRRLPEQDAILIYPEIFGSQIHTITNNKYIIYNQNCYYTFNSFPFLKTLTEDTYKNKNFIGFLTVSKDSEQYLKLTFPTENVARIHLGISSLFSFSPHKEKMIAFMPRKLKEDINQIYHILATNPHFKDWKWQAIDNCTEREVAEILQKSALFLSFNYNEGFGLPPVEAMACGCYVVGYAGNAGSEYLLDEFSSIVPDRNIVKFVNEIENRVKLYNQDPEKMIKLGQKASLYVQEHYNLSKEEQTTLTAINNLIDKQI